MRSTQFEGSMVAILISYHKASVRSESDLKNGEYLKLTWHVRRSMGTSRSVSTTWKLIYMLQSRDRAWKWIRVAKSSRSLQ